jgi:hypothetical protein
MLSYHTSTRDVLERVACLEKDPSYRIMKDKDLQTFGL